MERQPRDRPLAVIEQVLEQIHFIFGEGREALGEGKLDNTTLRSFEDLCVRCEFIAARGAR